MHYNQSMKIALAARNGQVAPLFSGVEVLIYRYESGKAVLEKRVQTSDWPALAWGPNLMREDVSLLICDGLDHFLWGSLRGYGINVAPEAGGKVDEALGLWQHGKLPVPETWPPVAVVCARRGAGRRNRWRGGC